MVSLLYALAFAAPIADTFGKIVDRLMREPGLALPWMVAAVGVIFGHLIRSMRAKILFSPTVSTGVAQQFGAILVGSLCNSVLPFRLGELVRADVLAQSTSTSFSFSFVLVVLERAVDALVMCLMLAVFGRLSLPLLIVAAILFFVLLSLWSSPLWLKHLFFYVAEALERGRGSRMLFRVWSVEYGLQRTLVSRVLLPYVGLSVLNWVVYIVALLPLFFAGAGMGLIDAVGSSVATYAALNASVAPGALGSFTPTLAAFGLFDSTMYIMAWCAAIVPTCILGLIWAFVGMDGIPLFRPKRESVGIAPANKLTRDADPSASQGAFLRDYYAGVPLAAEISRDDMEGTASLGRYFTGGGSAAVTYLSERDGRLWVTKRVDLQKSQALREQHEWLVKHACANVAIAGGEREDDSTYSMDVGFDPNSVDGFDWVHQCSVEQACVFMDEVASTLAGEVWLRDAEVEAIDPAEGAQRVESYINTHVRHCMQLAVDSMPALSEAMLPDSLVINGIVRPNLNRLLDELEGNESAMLDLADFRLCSDIHGDPIVDNLLWSRGGGHPVIIDPVPCGNVFDGPVFDFGKWSQSLQIGYEFALRDTSEVRLRPDSDGVLRVIEYADMRSERYEELWEHVQDVLAPKYLTSSEQKTMLFIGATNYFRRMKHQVLQCPANALKFYALGIEHLDEWMEMYR